MTDSTLEKCQKMAGIIVFLSTKVDILEMQEKSLLKQVDYLERILSTQDQVMSTLGNKISILEAETNNRLVMDQQMTDLIRRIEELGESLDEMWRRLNQQTDPELPDEGFAETSG